MKKLFPLGTILILFVLAYSTYIVFPSLVKYLSPSTVYQAVFLTNGQVYFGKLNQWSTMIGHDLVLTNVYYLQAGDSSKQTPKQLEAPSSAKSTSQLTTPTPTPTPTAPELSLIKLGSELHAPEDKLVINRSSVLFWENLKENGKVVRAITNFKQK